MKIWSGHFLLFSSAFCFNTNRIGRLQSRIVLFDFEGFQTDSSPVQPIGNHRELIVKGIFATEIAWILSRSSVVNAESMLTEAGMQNLYFCSATLDQVRLKRYNQHRKQFNSESDS